MSDCDPDSTDDRSESEPSWERTEAGFILWYLRVGVEVLYFGWKVLVECLGPLLFNYFGVWRSSATGKELEIFRLFLRLNANGT